MKSALLTALAAALAWAAWHYGAEAMQIVGLGDIDIIGQLAAVFLVLTLAERGLARWQG